MAFYSPPSSRGTKSLLQLVQCPVCHKLPTPPVYGCQNGHIICESCKDKVPHCSVCRADKFNVRNIIVEEILKGRNLQCPFCETSELSGEELKRHATQCPCRPVECNCKVRRECVAEMVPRDLYESHMRRFHGLREAEDEGEVTIKYPMIAGFHPQSFKAFKNDFILNSSRTETQIFTWLSYLGDTPPNIHAEIRLYYDQVHPQLDHTAIVARAELKSTVGITPLSLHLTPEEVLKTGHCLEVKTDGNNNANLPPYIWPGFDVQAGTVPAWGYSVKMWKPQPNRNSRSYSRFNKRSSSYVMNTAPTTIPITHYPQQPYPDLNPENNDEDEDFLDPDVQEQLAIYQPLTTPAQNNAQPTVSSSNVAVDQQNNDSDLGSPDTKRSRVNIDEDAGADAEAADDEDGGDEDEQGSDQSDE